MSIKHQEYFGVTLLQGSENKNTATCIRLVDGTLFSALLLIAADTRIIARLHSASVCGFIDKYTIYQDGLSTRIWE